MEVFEEIRREYPFGVGTIRGVAAKLNVHRRIVRRASRARFHPSGSGRNDEQSLVST